MLFITHIYISIIFKINVPQLIIVIYIPLIIMNILLIIINAVIYYIN